MKELCNRSLGKLILVHLKLKKKKKKGPDWDPPNFSLEETIDEEEIIFCYSLSALLFPEQTVKLDNKLIKNNLESGAQLWPGKMLLIMSRDRRKTQNRALFNYHNFYCHCNFCT